MSLLDRDETLRRLKAMEKELQTIDQLQNQKRALEQSRNQVSVKENDYDTGHLARVRDAQETARRIGRAHV